VRWTAFDAGVWNAWNLAFICLKERLLFKIYPEKFLLMIIPS